MQSSPNLNSYWLLLKDLSAEEKLSLIELLVKSLQATRPAQKAKQPGHQTTKSNWAHRFEGSWNDFPETAEELIAIVENSRTLGREVEML